MELMDQVTSRRNFQGDGNEGNDGKHAEWQYYALTFIFHSPFQLYYNLLSSEIIKEWLGVHRHRLQSDEKKLKLIARI